MADIQVEVVEMQFLERAIERTVEVAAKKVGAELPRDRELRRLIMAEAVLRYRRAKELGDGELLDSIIEFLKWLLEGGANSILVEIIKAILELFL